MNASKKLGVRLKPARRIPAGYPALLGEIKARIRSAQYEALRAVNKELVKLYWGIGRSIRKRRSFGAHGDAIVKRLAADLQNEFPGIAGFSWRNLFYMAEFYAAYRNLPKLQPLVAIIGWSHNLVILQRCGDPLAREFYIRMTNKFGWTKDVLALKINSQTYDALRESNKPIGVATYQIVKRLPKELAAQLPDPKQIEALMLDLGRERKTSQI